MTQKIVTKLSEKYGLDPGSGKNLSRIWIQGSKKHRILVKGQKNTGSATLHFIKGLIHVVTQSLLFYR